MLSCDGDGGTRVGRMLVRILGVIDGIGYGVVDWMGLVVLCGCDWFFGGGVWIFFFVGLWFGYVGICFVLCWFGFCCCG